MTESSESSADVPKEREGSSERDAEPADKEPEDQRGYVVQTEALRIEQRQGPLPDAGEMERYNQILPGAADRLLMLAESEVSHRHRMERWGQLAGVLLPVVFVSLGAVIVLVLGSWMGVALAAVGLTPAGYSFLRDITSRGR